MSATAADALSELLEGNRRFVGGSRLHPHQDAERRAALAQAQAPFAVVFGCSDSRMAAEIIFDRGLGDLFVVRTAGHTIGPEVLGSVEYAIRVLNTPLVVVLGHDSCGAVGASRDAVVTGRMPSGHLRAVAEAIAPSVHDARRRDGDDVGVDEIVDVHVRRTIDLLREEFPGTAMVGMSYRLGPGVVRLVD